jgi:hypothetical protein
MAALWEPCSFDFEFSAAIVAPPHLDSIALGVFAQIAIARRLW